MLTRMIVRNFKRFENVEIELGNPVVFIGPNNSGKTTALQSLSLWAAGLTTWNGKRSGKTSPEKRPGVIITRRDLVTVPVPNANLLWRNLHVRDVQRDNGKPRIKNVRIGIILEGITNNTEWTCGLEFDYANEEYFYCRPLRTSEEKGTERMPIPEEASEVHIAFLPPMSGLTAKEDKLEPGSINVRVGEGRTAEVLRNLCFNVFTNNPGNWDKVVRHMESFFSAELEEPRFIPSLGYIELSYREKGIIFDILSSGRGFQQVLLLMVYMYANPGTVLLLDEPDAHLEILRQRQVYQLLVDVARENNNQIIAASHSEVLLTEAASRDMVVAFVGKPHRIDDRGSQVVKALKEIGFEDFYLAEQTGWVLYLEGSTDLAILRAFARTLKHDRALQALERPFVKYIGGNDPWKAGDHFHGLREACPNLLGYAIFDRLEKGVPPDLCSCGMLCDMWQRREIENYLCYPESLEAYAESRTIQDEGPLFAHHRINVMKDSINELEKALRVLNKSPWDNNLKASDDFLTPLFRNYFEKLGIYNLMAKKSFYELAQFVPIEKIDKEVVEKLNIIAETFEKANESGKSQS